MNKDSIQDNILSNRMCFMLGTLDLGHSAQIAAIAQKYHKINQY